MKEGGRGDPDGRLFPRFTVSFAIELTVSVHGFDADARAFEAHGTTVNISRSGLLARVDRSLPTNRRCLVHLPEAGDRVGRTLLYGVVQRSTPADDRHEVAIEFENPLDFLEPPSDEQDA